MKNKLILCAALAATAMLADGLLVSSTSKTVTETITDELRQATIDVNRVSGAITVTVNYERVVRSVDGDTINVLSATALKQSTVPWDTATNLIPALGAMRTQLQAALPTLLSNP